jgi:hypothetical protein
MTYRPYIWFMLGCLCLLAIVWTARAKAESAHDAATRLSLPTPIVVPPAKVDPPVKVDRKKIIVISGSTGGELGRYMKRFKEIEAAGREVEILGMCQSACTLVTFMIAKERICFGPDAYLNFHVARKSYQDYSTPDIEATKWIFERYPYSIRTWLTEKGGIEKLPLNGHWTLTAQELWAMHWRKCSD